MSAFSQNEFESATTVGAAHVSIQDHLAMIDAAYHADNRSTCAKMIDDLYARFDLAS